MASKIFLGALLSAAAFAAPLEERQNCATVWGQCGGNGWTGPTCCAAGSVCSVGNPWYSQCLPGTAPPPASSTTTSRPPSSSAAPPSSTVVPGSSTRPTSVVVPTTSAGVTSTSSGPAPTGGATYSGNPFVGVNQWANAYYRSEILSLAVPSLTGPLATAAAKVAEVPTFQWMDTRAKVPLVDTALGEIRAANARGGNNAGIFVVYNLPDRDCAAAASNGELAIADDGVNKYKAYIDSIRAVLLKYSDVRTILVIEPDSLANMCQNAAAAYQECTVYALKQLDLPNVAQYLDAGHAGWLGWPANIEKAADVFAKVYNDAGKPRSVRGFATNVSNYNSIRLSQAPSYTTPNPNFDEERYINAFAPLLRSRGFDAKFIVDQGRSGKQPTGQVEWGHWCNSRGVGFGARPSTNTGNTLIDAVVWIKPGGEADGTSDSSAPRFDTFCRSASSVIPAPEAGTWFQAYFQMLLENANPSFL